MGLQTLYWTEFPVKDQHLDFSAVADDVTRKVTERYGLTRQQSRVLELMLIGRRNTEIALVLDISVRTVRAHVHAIFEKTSIDGREEVSRLVLEIVSTKEVEG